VKTASTPMETQKSLLKDEYGEELDVHMYRSMIGSFMYLTSSRPDITFAMCACARYQVNLKFWSTAMAKTINGEAQLHAKVDGKKIIVIESSIRRDLRLGDEKDKDHLKKEINSQQDEIASLKKRVKNLENRNKSRTRKLNRLYKVGLSAMVESSGDKESLEVVDVAQVSTAATSVTITTEEITLAQALEELKTSKPKGKGIMIEESVKPNKKDQIRLDEEAALELQAKFDEEERLAREKAKKEQEANIALIET
nr:hypothetical protein [Tanacetum cinerariifolium]